MFNVLNRCFALLAGLCNSPWSHGHHTFATLANMLSRLGCPYCRLPNIIGLNNFGLSSLYKKSFGSRLNKRNSITANSIVLLLHVSESDWLFMLACSLIDAFMSSIVCLSRLPSTSLSPSSVRSLFLNTSSSLAIFVLIVFFLFAGRSFSFAVSLSLVKLLLIG